MTAAATNAAAAALGAIPLRPSSSSQLIALVSSPRRLQAIRAAADGAAARAALVGGFGLSEAQADGVLALTLRRLTGLEAGKLVEERGTLEATVAELQVCLGVLH